MERFRMALDRWEAQDTPANEALPRRAEQPATQVAKPEADGKDIVYTQTRVAPLGERQVHDARVIAATDDPRAGSFKVLRTQVLRGCRKNGWKTIGVVSLRHGAGKTFAATNLAVSISREPNQTVLLIDLDLHIPKVADTFGWKGDAGIIECIRGERTVADVIFNPGMERLVVLPGATREARGSELLASPAAKTLMKEVIERYDSRLIVCDLPPLTAADDTLVCMPFLDAVVLVIEAGRTTQAELQHATELIEGKPVAAVVLNKVRDGDDDNVSYEYAYR